MIRFSVLLFALTLGGCASAPPPWHDGFLDSLSDYYDQGTGISSTSDKADRNAQAALVGYQQGVEIESATEGNVQSIKKDGDEMIVEIMTRNGLQRISGTLPPGSYIAERWRDKNGNWWSYAVSEKSGKDLSYFDQQANERYVPTVIEPSAGADRTTLAVLCNAYCEEEVNGEKRTVMRLAPKLAPI